MSQAIYEQVGSEPEGREHFVRFVGGSAAVTKVFGNGITVTYVTTGKVKLTWSQRAQNPGVFCGVKGYCFQATTQADVKSYVLVPGVYDGTTRSLELHMFESGSLADLAASEWLSVTLLFKETGSGV